MDATTQGILIVLFTVLFGWALYFTIEAFYYKALYRLEEKYHARALDLLDSFEDCGCECCKLDKAYQDREQEKDKDEEEVISNIGEMR